MRCIHCSSVIERTDWFCPNCRRSPRPAMDLRPKERPGWKMYAACIAIAGALTTAGAAVGMRMARPPAPERADIALVSVRDVEPEVRALAVERGADALPERDPEETPRPARGPERGSPLMQAAERSPRSQPREGRDPAARGAVTVLTEPPVPTYVYLNGGSLLGEAPLRDAALPPGRHRLTFWTPSLGGRSTRVVDVRAGDSLLVVEPVVQQPRFADTAGG